MNLVYLGGLGPSHPPYRISRVIPVNIVLSVGGQVVVDDEGDLLDVDASREKIGGDENAGRSRAELAHDDVPLFLVHVAVHRGYREVA